MDIKIMKNKLIYVSGEDYETSKHENFYFYDNEIFQN